MINRQHQMTCLSNFLFSFFCIISVYQFLIIYLRRDTQIEDAVNLLDRSDIIIKLVSSAVIAKWLARNRRYSDVRITEEDVRVYMAKIGMVEILGS